MNLFLDIDGTLLQRNFISGRNQIITDNIEFIKMVIGDEKIESITFISFGLFDEVACDFFMQDWGGLIARLFGVEKHLLHALDCSQIKGVDKQAMFMNTAKRNGHSMFFDDTLKQRYQAFKNDYFEWELFKV
jgi:hypothetical protein